METLILCLASPALIGTEPPAYNQRKHQLPSEMLNNEAPQVSSEWKALLLITMLLEVWVAGATPRQLHHGASYLVLGTVQCNKAWAKD